MTEHNDERLLGEIARRNWLILGVLLLFSLFWRAWPVTLGVGLGGLVAIAGYYWLHRSLRRLLFGTEPGAGRRFQFGYLVRLATLAVILILMLKAGVHPLALAAGLSVVVLNIFWTTLIRAI